MTPVEAKLVEAWKEFKLYAGERHGIHEQAEYP